MYAVIFIAQLNKTDETYSDMAARMRALAIDEYGCSDFTSVTEGDTEIAVSYWQTRQQIQAWKNNPEHQQAQALGKAKWYKSYTVQVVEVVREYGRLA